MIRLAAKNYLILDSFCIVISLQVVLNIIIDLGCVESRIWIIQVRITADTLYLSRFEDLLVLELDQPAAQDFLPFTTIKDELKTFNEQKNNSTSYVELGKKDTTPPTVKLDEQALFLLHILNRTVKKANSSITKNVTKIHGGSLAFSMLQLSELFILTVRTTSSY